MLPRQKIVYLTVVLVLVLFSIFVIRPVILGYSTYRQMERTNYSVQLLGENLQDLQSELSMANNNLSLYAGFTQRLYQQVDTLSLNLSECVGERKALQQDTIREAQRCAERIANAQEEKNKEVQECLDDAALKESQLQEDAAANEKILKQEQQQCKLDLANATKDAKTSQDTYDKVIADAARRICCKEKVDNSQISFYDIFNGKLICSESGGKELKCFT